MKVIDARGLACPAPVLQTKAALEQERLTAVDVVVDNTASQQNIERFLQSQGFETERFQKESDYHVIGRGAAAPAPAGETVQPDTAEQKIMVMISNDRLGSGDDDLGRKLMLSFIKTLKEVGSDLWRLVFVNNGVKLTIAGAEALSDLQSYEAAGLQILVCGTCLDHFDLLDQKRVGETTNMLDVVTAMHLADKVINI